jgi:roadblock/LC7 domain-containing protein
MNEFDELVKIDGGLMAGRIGPDWGISEHKSNALYVGNPAATQMAQWFCAAITMMFRSMALAVDAMNQNGFDQTSWLPLNSWSYSGGDYAIGVRGGTGSGGWVGGQAWRRSRALRSWVTAPVLANRIRPRMKSGSSGSGAAA